jgi:hypothetical protein
LRSCITSLTSISNISLPFCPIVSLDSATFYL